VANFGKELNPDGFVSRTTAELRPLRPYIDERSITPILTDVLNFDSTGEKHGRGILYELVCGPLA